VNSSLFLLQSGFRPFSLICPIILTHIMSDYSLQDKNVEENESKCFSPLPNDNKEMGDAKSASDTPETVKTSVVPLSEGTPVRTLHGVKVYLPRLYKPDVWPNFDHFTNLYLFLVVSSLYISIPQLFDIWFGWNNSCRYSSSSRGQFRKCWTVGMDGNGISSWFCLYNSPQVSSFMFRSNHETN